MNFWEINNNNQFCVSRNNLGEWNNLNCLTSLNYDNINKKNFITCNCKAL